MNNNEENNFNIFFSKPNEDSSNQPPKETINNMTGSNNIATNPNQISQPNVNSTSVNTNQNMINQPPKEIINNMTGSNNIAINPTVQSSNTMTNNIISKPSDVKQTSNLIAEPNQLKTSFNINNDEVLLKAFIGNNYDKITNKKVNFSAMFLAPLYICYRKMALIGILIFLISFVLSVLVNPILLIAIYIIIGFTFNKFYLKYAHTKIAKIQYQNQDKNIDELTKLCENKGGTSVLRLIGGFLVQTVLASIVIAILVAAGLISLFGDFVTSFGDKINSSINGKYEGLMIYDSSINMEEQFSITPIEPFQNKSKQYNYKYNFENEETTEIFNDCEFSLSAVKGYSDGDNLIRQMADYNADIVTNNISTLSINNINWTWFSKTSNIGKTYYYGTTKNNKAYLFEYEIQNGASPNCASYLNQILNSIVQK